MTKLPAHGTIFKIKSPNKTLAEKHGLEVRSGVLDGNDFPRHARQRLGTKPMRKIHAINNYIIPDYVIGATAIYLEDWVHHIIQSPLESLYGFGYKRPDDLVKDKDNFIPLFVTEPRPFIQKETAKPSCKFVTVVGRRIYVHKAMLKEEGRVVDIRDLPPPVVSFYIKGMQRRDGGTFAMLCKFKSEVVDNLNSLEELLTTARRTAPAFHPVKDVDSISLFADCLVAQTSSIFAKANNSGNLLVEMGRPSCEGCGWDLMNTPLEAHYDSTYHTPVLYCEECGAELHLIFTPNGGVAFNMHYYQEEEDEDDYEEDEDDYEDE